MAAKQKPSWTFARTENGYRNMWNSISVKDGVDASNARRFAEKIEAGKPEYMAVEMAIGVPWFFVGALHMRESSNDFKGVLHNGQKIIGTNKKTTLVPKGRGPFATWHEAAIDALTLKGFDKIKDWSPARMGFESERFNGLGYVGKAVNSAYLWAGSNHEQLGKYVADHVWDKKFDDPQIGTMTVLKMLCDTNPEVARRMNASNEPKPAASAPSEAPVSVTPIANDVRKPGVLETLWGVVRGKDVAVKPVEKARPGLAPNGDPQLWDQQDLLSSKGYTEVGQPDGLMGRRTRNAIKAFRDENGLPGAEIFDAKLSAALLTAGPRKIPERRATIEAQDLRKSGNSQISVLDSLGGFAKLLIGGGALGGIQQSGVLDRASETLQSAQDTLGLITTILSYLINALTWCFTHWWLFAIAGGIYVSFRVATGILKFVVLVRQGIVTQFTK